MSVWESEQVEERIIAILNDVPGAHGTHHFGPPYVSAYQLAIEMERRHPEVRTALGYPLGGAGVGERNSLAQYLAKQLSDRIKANPTHPVQGSFITNEDLIELVYRDPEGRRLVSTLTDSGYDLSLFRLRPEGA
jgi:hypothetical protein